MGNKIFFNIPLCNYFASEIVLLKKNKKNPLVAKKISAHCSTFRNFRAAEAQYSTRVTEAQNWKKTLKNISSNETQ